MENFKKTPDFKNADNIRTRAYTDAGYNRAIGKINSFSFQKGMVVRIGARLREIKKSRIDEMKKHEETFREKQMKNVSSSKSLMVVKTNHVDDAFKKLSDEIKLRTHRAVTTRSVAGNAYGAGRAAGDKVNLGRPVSSGSTPALTR